MWPHYAKLSSGCVSGIDYSWYILRHMDRGIHNNNNNDLAMMREATVAVPRKLTRWAAPPTEADCSGKVIMELYET